MTGQDGLRNELYSAVTDVLIASPQARRNVADAVLSVVQRHIDAARERVAEQIAQAIEGVEPPRWAVVQTAYDEATRIAREHAKGDGDG